MGKVGVPRPPLHADGSVQEGLDPSRETREFFSPSSAQALTDGPPHPERAALTDEPLVAPRAALTAVPAQDVQRLGQALENGSSNKDNIKNEKSNHKTESRGGGRELGDNNTSSCL